MMEASHEVAGLILAGGQSLRFGYDKALAMVGGEPMIARVYRALAPCCAEVIVSVGSADVTYSLPGPARLVADRADTGPIAGLAAGLAATGGPWILAVACDLPHLTTDVLRTLIDARKEDADAVVGVTPEGRQQPLCACYHRRVLPTVRDQIDQQRYALNALLDRLTVHTVPVPADALCNVNTPDDLPGSMARTRR